MYLPSYKTQSANKKTVTSTWVTIDATKQIVGRLASRIAFILRGKHKPYYTPHVDCGDHVIVTNAAKVFFTGKKERNKSYISHTGYPGGQKVTTPDKIRSKHPTEILGRAIKGMLPKNKLGRSLFKKLHIYQGPVHPHQAQQPIQI